MSNITIEQVEISLTLEKSPDNTILVSEMPTFSLDIVCPEIVVEIQPQVYNEIHLDEIKIQTLELVTEGPQGPQGPAGISGTTTQGIAGENISALKIVRSINATDIVKADSSLTFEEAKTLGLSTNSGATGATIDVIFFGPVSDPSFNFPNQEPLFLTVDGSISNVQDPLSLYNTTIGHSLGAGAIFINLQEPIEL